MVTAREKEQSNLYPLQSQSQALTNIKVHFFILMPLPYATNLPIGFVPPYFSLQINSKNKTTTNNKARSYARGGAEVGGTLQHEEAQRATDVC